MILFFENQFQTDREFNEFFLGILVIIIVICISALAIFLSIDRYRTIQWKKGFFPAKMKFNKDNLLKAYISLSASMIRRDISDNSNKIAFMIEYFGKEFPQNNFDFKSSFNFAMRYPIKLTSVGYWLNTHLKDEIYRLQIIYFLTGLSMTNGQLNKDEYKLLQYLVDLFHLKQKDLESIIAMYYRSEKKQKKTSRARNKTRFSKSKLSICQKILGVSNTSSNEDVKKAYRKLVMLHHPDKFENEGTDQLRLAKERFLKIQEAYEYLVKNQVRP